MSKKIKLRVTGPEIDALNMVRGLKEDAHYMVILAKDDGDGAILEGTEKTFSDLLFDLYEEVEYKMQPKSRLKHIRSIIDKLEPEAEF